MAKLAVMKTKKATKVAKRAVMKTKKASMKATPTKARKASMKATKPMKAAKAKPMKTAAKPIQKAEDRLTPRQEEIFQKTMLAFETGRHGPAMTSGRNVVEQKY